MEALFSESTECSENTFKRILLLGSTIVFIDKPSLTFGDWGIVGRQSQMRDFAKITAECGLDLKFAVPPHGRPDDEFMGAVDDDWTDPAFRKILVEGIKSDPLFISRFLGLTANYSGQENRVVTGENIAQALIADGGLVDDMRPVPERTDFKTILDTREGRLDSLKRIAFDVSVQIGLTLRVSHQHDLDIVSESVTFEKLLCLRMNRMANKAALLAPVNLDLAICSTILPDPVIESLNIDQVAEYRAENKRYFGEYQRLTRSIKSSIHMLTPTEASEALPEIVEKQLLPMVTGFKAELENSAKKMFSNLINNSMLVGIPTLYSSHSFDPKTLAMMGVALAVTAANDYVTATEQTRGNNSLSYLLTLRNNQGAL